MSPRITWTPPALMCTRCGEAAPSTHWALEQGAARCPCCGDRVPFHEVDVTDW